MSDDVYANVNHRAPVITLAIHYKVVPIKYKLGDSLFKCAMYFEDTVSSKQLCCAYAMGGI